MVKKNLTASVCLLISQLVIFGALQVRAQNFVSASTNLPAAASDGVTVADVNGDGRLDLISPDVNDNEVLVFTNKGNGTFSPAVTYKVGGNPYWVTAADVNHDSKADLICANSYDNTVTVLTNNGGGIFGSNATYAVGSSPRSVIAADINGSGRAALITANYNGNTLTVLTNNGNGVYGSNATYTVGANPVSVIAVDINGSGRPALICANFSADTVSIYTNNGSGIFGSNATINATVGVTGDALYSVTAANLYGHGRPALVCADYYGRSLLLLTNTGNGRFLSNAAVNVSLTVTWATATDLNGDGKPDLIALQNYGDAAVVFTNNGSGIFSSNASYAVGDYPLEVIAADMNNDGRPDLISANFFGNSLSVLTNATVFPSAGVAPALVLKRSGNGAVVSWPSASAGWELQQNGNPAGKNWLPGGYNGYDIADDGTNKSLAVAPLQGNVFFRLLHP